MSGGRVRRMDDLPSRIETCRRRWMRRLGPLVRLAVLAAAWAAPAAAQEAVDLELVLAIDASGSVDSKEFALQKDGLARAFRDPEVIAALEAYAPGGIAVALVQWSGRHQQTVAVDWTRLNDEASARAFADAIDATGRWILGETAVADALAYGVELLEGNRFAGARRTIDISGDGPTNSGGDPDAVRDAAAAAGITINGLAILNEIPTLDIYYTEHVIGGPDAFLLIAKDYQDFARAVRQKLLREIQGAGLAGRNVTAPRLAELR
jgi:hypothetical protein